MKNENGKHTKSVESEFPGRIQQRGIADAKHLFY